MGGEDGLQNRSESAGTEGREETESEDEGDLNGEHRVIDDGGTSL